MAAGEQEKSQQSTENIVVKRNGETPSNVWRKQKSLQSFVHDLGYILFVWQQFWKKWFICDCVSLTKVLTLQIFFKNDGFIK